MTTHLHQPLFLFQKEIKKKALSTSIFISFEIKSEVAEL